MLTICSAARNSGSSALWPMAIHTGAMAPRRILMAIGSDASVMALPMCSKPDPVLVEVVTCTGGGCAAQVELQVRIGCHTFRATGITAYLEAGGTFENAQAMAARESPRTTKLYDRTSDEITLDEVERITIRPTPAQGN